MDAGEFLKAVREDPGTNYFVATPDGAGLVILLPRVLAKIAQPEDVRIVDGAVLRADEARSIAQEARMAPIGGSTHTHFVIRRADRLSESATGALLQASEESLRARFIFLGRSLRPDTLASRSVRVRLPFLSKRAVLGNLQALRMDARAADEAGLWDGTLGGTARNVREGKAREQVRTALQRGVEGLNDVIHLAESPVFDRALAEYLEPAEHAFLQREASAARRGLLAFLVLSRRTAG